MGELFEEMRIGSLRAKNRLVRAATYERLATEDGHLTSQLRGIYDELAAGGAGTIIVSYAFVTRDEQPNPRMLGIYDDSFVPEYRELVDAAHAHDVRMISQIVYDGSATKLDPPSARILGPSAVANPKTGIVPAEASVEDIRMLAETFAAAARRARDAGFDGVELHAAHGYLLSQFLSPLFNRRADEYGGSVENRARLGAEVLAAIRREVGGEFPVLVKLNSCDGAEGGLVEDDSLAAARLFAEAGATAVEVSGAWRACRVRDFGGEPFFADYARRLVHEVGVPVILTGGNRNVAAMERLSREGVDGFGLCRPLICEPDLPKQWEADPAYQPRCVSCCGCDNTPGHRCILPGTPQVHA